MTQSTLASFDPHATHPFTNINAVRTSQSAAKHSKYSSVTQSSSTNANTPHSSSSVPQKTIHAPRPITQSSSYTLQAQKPIFVTFQQDRSSPELEEILLRRKLTQALGSTALGLDVKQFQSSS